MKKHIINAKARNLSTNLTNMRTAGILPGNLFQANQPSQPLELNLIEFKKLLSEIGESGVGYVKIDDKAEQPFMIDEVQFNHVTAQPIHVTLQVIDLTEKVVAEIPVELSGVFELPEAVLVTVRDEIEVEALPTDLPEKFVIDITTLTEIGQAVTLADLDYDRSKVEIVVGEEGLEAPVVLVQEVKEEVVEEVEEVVETEIIGEKDEEGADVAEGDKEADAKGEKKDEPAAKVEEKK